MSELELTILEKSVALVLQLVAVFLVPVVGLLAAQTLAALKKSKHWEQVRLAVRTAVRSAEQLELAGDLDRYADNKLDAAFAILERQLAASGVPIDLDRYRPILREMIEEAVRDLNLEQEFGLVEGP